MLAVNLGTRGAEAARNLVEYCNHPGGTYWSDLRLALGFREPHNTRLWCLGNEMDTDGQVGHKTAEEYGCLACETAKVMKLLDRTIELVACGSTELGISTFPAWEETVLDHTYEFVDYISLHTYLGNPENDSLHFLSKTLEMNHYILTVVSVCDLIQAKKRGKKRIDLSFNEWNVCHHWESVESVYARPWQAAPVLLEEAYTLEDALVVGCMLITLLKHADRVRTACLPQLVNVLAPIMTVNGGDCWRQTICYPFAQASQYGRGVALNLNIHSPVYEDREYGPVPYLEAVAVWNQAGENLSIFAVNQDLGSALPIEADARAFAGYRLVKHITLSHPNLKACNSADKPDLITPKADGDDRLEAGTLKATLPKASWNVIRSAKKVVESQRFPS